MESAPGALPRQSASERRTAIIVAAVDEFAEHGYNGASTETIAKRVGISQPYIFRLFGTKKDLFLAVIDHVYGNIIERFTRAAETAPARGVSPLFAMGDAYDSRIGQKIDLLMLLQSFAASGDPEIQAHVRASYRRVFAEVQRLSGAPHEDVYTFFANGMMITVVAALDIPELFGPSPPEC